MPVTIIDPDKIAIGGGITHRPIETIDAGRRIASGFDGAGLEPSVAFGMAVGKGERAVVTVKHGKGIHPSRRVGIEGPGAVIIAAGVGLLDEHHRHARHGNLRVFDERFLAGLHAGPKPAGDRVHQVMCSLAWKTAVCEHEAKSPGPLHGDVSYP